MRSAERGFSEGTCESGAWYGVSLCAANGGHGGFKRHDAVREGTETWFWNGKERLVTLNDAQVFLKRYDLLPQAGSAVAKNAMADKPEKHQLLKFL